MSKKAHVQKGKVYRPKNIIPVGATNIITDNITTESGSVANSSQLNAFYAKQWVDENHL